MELAPERKLYNNTPSPQRELSVKHDATCQDMMKVNLIGIEVEEKDYRKFQQLLTKEQQEKFLSMIIQNGLEELTRYDARLLRAFQT